MIFFVILLVALAALPLLRERRRRPVSDLRQADVPGAFVQLEHGLTHYRWYGRDQAPVIVCVHGLTTPSQAWNGLAPHLAHLGYRVLTYDLYGRGLSDQPRRVQSPAFFVAQLNELLDKLGVEGDVTVIGYSMGGVIATSFAHKHPDRVRHLALIGSGGMGHDLGGLVRISTELPVLGDWLFHMAFPRMHRQGIAAEEGLASSVPDIFEIQKSQLARRGFVPAVLSSLRGSLRRPLEAEHRDLAKQQVPVSAVFGDCDTVIPLRAMGRLAEWNRTAHQSVVEGAGHGLVYTHAAEVAEALRSALLVDRRL